MYGTNTPTSDIDFKEVFIPGGRDILLQKVKNSRAFGPEKENGAKNQAGDIDTQSFSISKLFSMIAKGDIIGCEMIFTQPEMIEFITPEYQTILDNKHIFMSKKIDGYVGYCRQQANKYGIRGSRIAAVRGLLELLIAEAKYVGGRSKIAHITGLEVYAEMTEHCSIVPIENGNSGQVMMHLECCDRKAPFTITVDEAIKIYQRVFDEYGHRALQAEKNEGVDWKAMSHAVRVGRQAVELLDTHKIIFPRPDAMNLLEIKRGEVPYKEVAGMLEQILVDVEKASVRSTLPDNPDYVAIDELIVKMHLEMM